MLKRDRKGLMNLGNVNTLNTQIAIYLLNFDFKDTVVTVQKYTMRHLINHLQAQYFALCQNLDLILFLAKNF